LIVAASDGVPHAPDDGMPVGAAVKNDVSVGVPHAPADAIAPTPLIEAASFGVPHASPEPMPKPVRSMTGSGGR
jgi:hypothetical protein